VIQIDDCYFDGVKQLLCLILVIVAWFCSPVCEAAACNVCHSKNPRMVRMHEEIGFKDCFKCHGQGLEKDPEKKKAQMTSDERCIACHKK
jgi:hypothetical protein